MIFERESKDERIKHILHFLIGFQALVLILKQDSNAACFVLLKKLLNIIKSQLNV